MTKGRRGRAGKGLATVLAATAVLIAGCGSKPPAGPGTGTASAKPSMPSKGTASVQIGGRRLTVHVPDSYDADRAARAVPLVLLLHGYSSNGVEQESYLKFTPESDRRGFIYAYPEGTRDSRNNQYWNATDACCDFDRTGVDDSGFLSDLIKTLQSTYRIDAKRVYVIGHSNGAFMAFRFACDHADQVAAIAALNGATWQDPSRCTPSGPVGVLAIHSTDDETIAYGGGTNIGNAYPSAKRTVTDWLGFDHCQATGRPAAALDLVTDLPGAETSVTTYTAGCAGGSSVHSWTINGGRHVPAVGPAFAAAVMDDLLARKSA
jgi:polyhydroxybutyrate depolymerase